MAEKRRTRKAQEVAEKLVEDLDKEILVEEKETPVEDLDKEIFVEEKETPVEDLDKETLAEEKEAPEKASPALKTGIVIPSLLNMRTGAGKEFPPIQRLKAGQTVEIIETVGKWYKVKVDEGEGFVMSEFVKV